MTKEEFREWVFQSLARSIADDDSPSAYGQMAEYLREIEGSKSEEVLESELRIRVSELLDKKLNK